MRVGLVGSGAMGRLHAAAWRRTGAELVGVLAASPESARSLARDYGLKVFESYSELLDASDIVDLCLPTDLHKDLTLQAAAAGKHVFCEKPIALSVDDGRSMIQACERAGVRLFVGMVLRFFPQYRAARQLFAEGELGRLGVMRLKRLSYPPHGGLGWFADEARSGGMVTDLMIHDFDYALWVGGAVSRVHAMSLKQREPASAKDYALVTLRFASGAVALVEGGWIYPQGVFRSGLDIAGSEGVVEWSSDAPGPLRRRLESPPSAAPAEVGLPLDALGTDPYALEIEHFYRALLEEKPFEISPDEALKALELALAARRSLKTGAPVTIGAA